MWKKLRRTLTGPEIPTIPWQMVVPTQGLFGSARIIVDWHPRTIAVELAQAPRFVLTDMGLPRFMATSLPPPRAVASTPEKVTLTVNGAPTPIAVGRRAMRRSTYIASVFVAGITYKLVPITVRKAKFYRNGEVISELASSKINGFLRLFPGVLLPPRRIRLLLFCLPTL